MSEALDRFYSELARLRRAPEQGRPLSDLPKDLPGRGVYFFFEPGEWRSADPSVARVVRVGTHALNANSKSTLRSRLKQHLGARAGGGNHRGSIFRQHVGAAMLNREKASLPSWGNGSSMPHDVRDDVLARSAELEMEKRVSAYLGAMTVCWIDISDEPGAKSERAYIERNAIALLSNQCSPADRPSETWLGRHSVREEIRSSGLWNLNYVAATCDADFVERFKTSVDVTGKGEV